MGLVKLAGITNWINPLDISNAAVSQSGNPVKYFLRKVKGGVPLFGRQAKQKAGLAAMGQTFAKMRDEGKVISSGGTVSSFLDGKAFSPIAFFANDANKLMQQNNSKGRLVREASRFVIDEQGHINRPGVEAGLKMAKKLNNLAHKFDNAHLYGAGIGGGIGAIRGYDNEDKTKSLKHGLIGAAIGGGIGFGAKKFTGKAKGGMIGRMAEAHDVYFADNYWANQIDAANHGAPRLAGKAFANLFTTTPNEAARRIAKSEARQELLLHPLGSGGLKDKAKNYFQTWKMFQPSVGVN